MSREKFYPFCKDEDLLRFRDFVQESYNQKVREDLGKFAYLLDLEDGKEDSGNLDIKKIAECLLQNPNFKKELIEILEK